MNGEKFVIITVVCKIYILILKPTYKYTCTYIMYSGTYLMMVSLVPLMINIKDSEIDLSHYLEVKPSSLSHMGE